MGFLRRTALVRPRPNSPLLRHCRHRKSSSTSNNNSNIRTALCRVRKRPRRRAPPVRDPTRSLFTSPLRPLRYPPSGGPELRGAPTGSTGRAFGIGTKCDAFPAAGRVGLGIENELRAHERTRPAGRETPSLQREERRRQRRNGGQFCCARLGALRFRIAESAHQALVAGGPRARLHPRTDEGHTPFHREEERRSTRGVVLSREFDGPAIDAAARAVHGGVRASVVGATERECPLPQRDELGVTPPIRAPRSC
jgi:hypothetical protein